MLRVRQIKVDALSDNSDNLKKAIAKKLKVNVDDIKNYEVKKQSLDARNKNKIFYVYEVDVLVNREDEVLNRIHNTDVFYSPNEEYCFKVSGSQRLSGRPVIIGSGPAGLFCAYLLAENGYRPLIIERGEKVEDRVRTVNTFWETGKLNKDSNVQFGEGGAGTFSDGKLNTLVGDTNNRGKKVFETFVECGAPDEILYSYKPHIGTDILVDVVKNMRENIISMGGEFLYNTCLTDLVINNGKIEEIVLNNSDRISCECLVLAIGHSSRDTFKMLFDRGFTMESKPFAI